MNPDYLAGAVDLHVHSAPDLDPRRFDDLDLAREAARAGMAAVLLKSHQASTVERAYLVSKVVAGIRVFGGLVLNEAVGGINPRAVQVALALGAKQIWMPTRDARNHRLHHGQDGGISIQCDSGNLKPQVREIVAAIAEAGCILGTGHLSPEEAAILIPFARGAGVRRILVTHPEWGPTEYPLDLQRELAAGGDVWFERCFVSTTHRCGHVPFSKIEDAIAAAGVDTTVLSTDLGQPDTPAPADGLRRYAERLHADGFTHDQIHRMMSANPARLLGL